MQSTLLAILLISFLPAHDFHTTIMNIKAKDDKKTYEIDLMVDTEHFEYLLNKVYDVDIRLGEEDEHPKCDSLITDYINAQIQLEFNRKKIDLELENKNVTFAETTLYFEEVCYRRRLKKVKMHNSFMLERFPSQKNLVNVLYKDSMQSMLFESDHMDQSIKF